MNLKVLQGGAVPSAMVFPDGSIPTAGQAEALTRIMDFLADVRKTSFFLEGPAGVGKTHAASGCVKGLLAGKARVIVAAPTNKAVNVIERNLDRALVPRVTKPKGSAGLRDGFACVDTVAGLLGIAPAVHDDEDEDNRGFAQDEARMKLPAAIVRAFCDGRRRLVLIVDEVSMLAKDQLVEIVRLLRPHGGKLIAVGDTAQLPPVKRAPIDFARDFDDGYELTEVTRQAKGNPLIDLAWAVRAGKNWWEVMDGEAVARVADAADEFIARGLAPPEDDEALRAVFVGYLNATVNDVQERACHKLYGHGRLTFREGELVLATRPGCRETHVYFDEDGEEHESHFVNFEQVVNVADPLRVRELRTQEAHKVYGTPVLLERVGLPPGAGEEERLFETYYLPGEAMRNPAHPYVQMKAQLLMEAKRVQAKLKERIAAGAAEKELRWLRQDHGHAWNEFHAHKDRVFSFAHPFAITSHKSQGSTYRDVYLDAGELAHWNKRALYVAATRPAQRLVWSWDIIRHPWDQRNTE